MHRSGVHVFCHLPACLQIAGQTAFFVALFRQHSRERVFEWAEALVPDVLPFLHTGGLTPVQVGCAAADQHTKTGRLSNARSHRACLQLPPSC